MCKRVVVRAKLYEGPRIAHSRSSCLLSDATHAVVYDRSMHRLECTFLVAPISKDSGDSGVRVDMCSLRGTRRDSLCRQTRTPSV